MNGQKIQIYFRIFIGCVVVLLAPFIPPDGILFFVVIFLPLTTSLVLQRVLNLPKDLLKRRNQAKQTILRTQPSEAWIAMSLTIFIPLLLGLVLYFGFANSYEMAASVFVGVSYMGAGLAQLRLEASLRNADNAVFD